MSAASPTLSAVSCGFSSSLVAETDKGGIVNLPEPTQSQTEVEIKSVKNGCWWFQEQVYSGQFTFLIWVYLPLIMTIPLPSLKGKILLFCVYF